ncbi:MAG: DUF3304 domain-containing protein [Comamonadaceae bacterium]|nr:MAG: DUF3304 domain-containing protein [Comamonadaceae bacterium]
MNDMNTATELRHIRIRMRRRSLRTFCLIALASWLGGCQEPTAGVSVVAYNHTIDRSIYMFTVDGRYGGGVSPESGGGGMVCCAQLPRRWHPDLKVRIRWEYQGGTEIPPPPPPHEVDVSVPRYQPAEMDELNVHFYPDHKVKVVVSNKTILHPDYPAELKWDAPTPRDAVAGRALPAHPPAEDYEELITRSYRTASAPMPITPPAPPIEPDVALPR